MRQGVQQWCRGCAQQVESAASAPGSAPSCRRHAAAALPLPPTCPSFRAPAPGCFSSAARMLTAVQYPGWISSAADVCSAIRRPSRHVARCSTRADLSRHLDRSLATRGRSHICTNWRQPAAAPGRLDRRQRRRAAQWLAIGARASSPGCSSHGAGQAVSRACASPTVRALSARAGVHLQAAASGGYVAGATGARAH